MDATDLLDVVALVALPANLVDWLFMQRSGFDWAPQRGPALYLSLACITVMIATSFARLNGLLPSSSIWWGATLPFIIWQVGAIWLRHATRRPSES